MTNTELYKWITDPTQLTRSTLTELKQLIDEYPYFHAARILYLKNLAILHDIRFDRELKRMAIHIPNRRQLYQLINTPPQQPASAPSAATTDYIHWLAQNTEDLPPANGADHRLQHHELIDSFIANQRNTFTPRPTPPLPDESAPPSLEKNTLDDTFFTETLARIYLKQKRYEKALEIIRVLSLKYPEKSAYFADQILYLEKIINIKK